MRRVHDRVRLCGAALWAAGCLPSTLVLMDGPAAVDAGPPDASVTDAGIRDAAPSPDASARDAGARDAATPGDAAVSCPAQPAWWTSEARQVVAAGLAWDAPRRMGHAELLEVTVALERACDVMETVHVTVMPGNATDFVTLSATAWTRTDCASQGRLVTAYALIRGEEQGNMRVVVDSAPSSGTYLLEYGREGCTAEGCACLGGGPPGTRQYLESCDSDCDCAQDRRCLPVGGSLNGAACQRPCVDDLACRGDHHCGRDAPGALPFTCDESFHCSSDADCPSSFTCLPDTGTCSDQRPLASMQHCACNQACRAHEWCMEGVFTGRTCEVPCTRDADCPGWEYSGTLCSQHGFCLPLE